MSLKIVNTTAGAGLSAGEVALIARGVARFGRVALIVPNRTERDACRRALADAGCLMGVEAVTPAAWVEWLAQLFGDGRRICTALERQLIMADVVAAVDEQKLAPLRANPGTVRMLSRMARDVLRAATSASATMPEGPSWAKVSSLLDAYASALAARGLIEASDAAGAVADAVEHTSPACARCAIVRDVSVLPRYLVHLLAAVARSGEVSVLLRGAQGALAETLEGAFSALGCEVARDALSGGVDATSPDTPEFLEVSGPHARSRAYADELVRLLGCAPAPSRADAPARAVVAAPRPAELFEQMAPYLVARGVEARATRTVRFEDTLVGRHFLALSDLARRLGAALDGALGATEWWPAPELTDWLYAPISGADAGYARAFDKKVRSSRALGVEGVLRELQSVQSRAAAARRKLPADSVMAGVPVVCSDVMQLLMQQRPVSALKAMLSAVVALPASAFGSVDGAAHQTAERMVAERAIEVLMEEARRLDVSQAVAVSVLEGLAVTVRCRTAAPEAAGSVATFMTLADAALLEPGDIDALLMADVDVSGYPLSHEEGPVSALAGALGEAPCELEPVARLRDQVARALAAPAVATLARVTHDRQAKDRYPAAIWTELIAAAGADTVEPRQVGEGDIECDFDPAAPAGAARRERVACLSPEVLSEAASAYIVPRQLSEAGELVPRQLSASQIEAYAECPLCWFVSYRVRPNTIDAGFSNMEKGNFVHDVMDRFHERLIELGLARVTPENTKRSIALLRQVFEEVRAEHERGKTASSAPLVPLSATERRQVDDILPQLEKVVRYEAAALAPFAPAYLEYSFNGLGATYAGWPLGGRIDRVDVDAEGRAVVIDYKHRSDAAPFRLKDPTVPNAKTGEVAADDPRWLPEHTQSLIYAQALRRTLGLDVRGALYFSTKGKVAMRGAVSAELAEQEPGDGRVPGLRDGFPAAESGGTMTFDELLDRVEASIAERLDELARGQVAPAETPRASCVHNHPLGFTRRDA